MAFDWTPPIYFDLWWSANSKQKWKEDDKEKVNHT